MKGFFHIDWGGEFTQGENSKSGDTGGCTDMRRTLEFATTRKSTHLWVREKRGERKKSLKMVVPGLLLVIDQGSSVWPNFSRGMISF